jgi:hypothetical protein
MRSAGLLFLVLAASLACKKRPPPAGTFDLDGGGPFIEARAIDEIRKEPVLAIPNVKHRVEMPLIHWDYDFKRWGWGKATLTHRSHSGPEVWRFTLADPVGRSCEGAFLAEKLTPVSDAGALWVLERGPLSGALVRRPDAAVCVLEIASREWAARERWEQP